MARTLASMSAITIALSLLFVFFLSMSRSEHVLAQSSPAASETLGSLTGTVTDPSGTPLAGIEVQFFRLTDDNYSLMLVVTAGANGDYRAPILPTGNYRVCVFSDWSNLTSSTCYGNPPGTVYPYGALDVKVQAGITTSEINLFIGSRYPQNAFLPMVAQ